MVDFLASLGTWNWWIAGILLLCIELVAPGTFMLWFGVAALTVGILSLFLEWGWQAQAVTFGVVAMVAVALSRVLLRRKPSEGDAPFLNRRADALVGRVFLLGEPILNGRGRLSIDDTVWRIAGPDLPAGSNVRVVRSEGTRLVVEATER
ncbi:NfeD family protein [Microbaculum marinum]|uniref:NfeD family protein n=1 Tax=Microbaculum marinum TaxID=1764581 RepID=A0AAW9RJL1_9HYPH